MTGDVFKPTKAKLCISDRLKRTSFWCKCDKTVKQDKHEHQVSAYIYVCAEPIWGKEPQILHKQAVVSLAWSLLKVICS